MDEHIPFWLDPRAEWTDEDEKRCPHPAPRDFVLACVDACLSAGLDVVQACEVAGNACVETGWGRAHRAHNYGGVKITKNTAGPGARWWRAAGHVASGDEPVCYYRAFASAQAFFDFWTAHFVPRPEYAAHSRYAKCGEQFWAHEPWFDDLIAAGYKGEVTKLHPEKSLAAEGQIDARVETFVYQRARGLAVDGAWGPRAEADAKAVQTAAGLEPTGKLDRATLWAACHPGQAIPAWAAPAKPKPTKEKAPASPSPSAQPAPAKEQPADGQPAGGEGAAK
jgi:hypothetical protein